MAFENLVDVWEKVAQEYHSNASSNWQEYMQMVQDPTNPEGSTQAMNTYLDERSNQNYSIPTIQPQLYEIDTTGSPNETMLNEQGISISNPEYNPQYGQSVMVENPLPPIVNISQSDSVLNKWSDPITFSLFAEPALLGITPPKTPQSSTMLGEVDYFNNDNVTGYSAIHRYPNSFFVGIGGESPNLTFGEDGVGLTQLWTNTDYGDFPGPMDNWLNTHATGFTLNQFKLAPSRFVGIGGESPDFTYGEGDSITSMYSTMGVGDTGQTPTAATFEGDSYSFDNGLPAIDATEWTIPEGFTYQNSEYGVNAIDTEFPGPVDFMKGENSYYNTLNPVVPGFTLSGRSPNTEFNIGGYTFGDGDVGNSKYLNISTGTHNGYHDANITFGTAVDFMNGVNSYYNTLNPVVPGFTLSGKSPNTEFNIGGYTFGDGDVGNSKYIQSDGTIIPTGTHTRPIHPFGNQTSFTTSEEVTFSNTVGGWFTSNLPAGADETWEIPTDFTYQDSIHTTNALSGTGNDVFGGPVNFMKGRNSYYPTLDPVVSGYTLNFGTAVEGGVLVPGYLTPAGDDGISRYLNVSTGTHIQWGGSLSLDIQQSSEGGVNFSYNNNSLPNDIGFTPNQGNLSFPGGYDSEMLQGESIFFDENKTMISTETHTITGYGGTDSFEGNLNFDGTVENGNLFSKDTTTLQNKIKNINRSKSGQFDILYNNNQTVNEINKLGDPSLLNLKSKSHQSVEPSREGETGAILNITTLGLNTLLDGVDVFGGTDELSFEPYNTFEIGDKATSYSSQFFPKSRLAKDIKRISQFLSSVKGDQFILNQNLMGQYQNYKTLYDPSSTLLNVAAPKEGLGVPMFNFPRDVGIVGSLIDLIVPNTYSEWLDARALGDDQFGIPNTKAQNQTYAEVEINHKPLAFKALNKLDDIANDVVGAIFPAGDPAIPTPIDTAGVGFKSKINSTDNMQMSMAPYKGLSLGKGDIMTLAPVAEPGTNGSKDTETLEASKFGMPFYFKDLRDNAVIIFRAYLDGISDTISPTWNSENYIGRSEPVYTYTNAEREIAFNLKLFAQTKDELNMIYTKMNRLTSLCYPEYKNQVVLKNGEVDEDATSALGESRVMMKAPLTKFRLGELFGTSKAEMAGFIKSLSYTFPDESPWEIQNGKRVPKYVAVSMTYQVIHSDTPSLDFAISQESNQQSFYGINEELGVDYNPLNDGLGV